MNFASTSCVKRNQNALRSGLASLFALGLIGLCPAHAADKPPLAPDTVVPFSTNSRLSAGIEFSLPALAADIERDIPQRLASIDEKIECVHRRILFWKVNANCDVWGYVERSGGVSLYGRGDRVYGSVPIHGVLEGQGANRFTARIHGETEASATIEATARPQLSRDWSLDLHFGDGFRWSEPPVLQVMGREIPVAKYAEPRIRTQLAVVREHALAAARRLDLHDKAATAWRHAFEPIQLSDSPAVWLQMTPQNVSFAGMRANPRTLRGSIELSGTAQTIVGQNPPAVAATALPMLGDDVSCARRVRCHPAGAGRLRRAQGKAVAGDRRDAAGGGDLRQGRRRLSVIGQARHRPARRQGGRYGCRVPGNGSISRARSRPTPAAVRSGSPTSAS